MKKDDIYIVTLILIIFIIWSIVAIVYLKFSIFRNSDEGKCFTKLAEEYCLIRGLNLLSLSPTWMKSDFRCSEWEKSFSSVFNVSDKNKCGDFYK